ncbi:hypothetical protein ACFO60_00005, partial [Sphaerisporangium dianthi]
MRRIAARLTAAAAALAILASPTSPAAGEPGPRPSPARATGASAGAVHQVTLITGDVVTVRNAAAGRYGVSVRPARGREEVRFLSQEVDGALRITPADMVPYVAADLVDERLFDVTGLIRQGYDDAAAPALPLVLAYGDAARSARTALPGAGAGTPLESVGARAVAVDKGRLDELWQAAEPAAAPAGAARA